MGRRLINQVFVWVCLAVASLSLLVLSILLAAIFVRGFGFLSLDFLLRPPHYQPEKAGIHPALLGAIWLCAICGLTALPLGVSAAIFLEEYHPQNRWLKKLHGFIQLNIANLAGVPSVVYGLLGLTAFVEMFGLFGSPHQPGWEIGVRWADHYRTIGGEAVSVPAAGKHSPSRPLIDGMQAYTAEGREVRLTVLSPKSVFGPNSLRAPAADQEQRMFAIYSDASPSRNSEHSWWYLRLPFGRSVLAGGLTLMLVVLPILIIASQEALRAAPLSLREGALGLGATRWQTIWKVTLPASVPGIMTGSILAMSRAIGETAPLLIITGIVFITSSPQNVMDDFTAIPLQIFNWARRPQESFQEVAASGIIVLLTALLFFNGLAIFLRHKLQKPLS